MVRLEQKQGPRSSMDRAAVLATGQVASSNLAGGA